MLRAMKHSLILILLGILTLTQLAREVAAHTKLLLPAPRKNIQLPRRNTNNRIQPLNTTHFHPANATTHPHFFRRQAMNFNLPQRANTPEYSLDAATTTFCVAQAPQQVGLQVRIYPNREYCRQNGDIHLYNFISFKEPIKGVASEPWSYCENTQETLLKGAMNRQEDCSGNGWVLKAAGFEGTWNLERQSFVSKTQDNTHMWMQFEGPHLQKEGFKELSVLRHLAVLRPPSQEDWKFMYEEVYKKENSPFYFRNVTDIAEVDRDGAQRLQLLINRIGGIDARVAIEERMDNMRNTGLWHDFKAVGWDFEDVYQLHLARFTTDKSDKIRRAHFELRWYFPREKVYVSAAEFTVPTTVALSAPQVRTVLTEALRAQSMVRVETAGSGKLMMVTVPRRLVGGRVSIYWLY